MSTNKLSTLDQRVAWLRAHTLTTRNSSDKELFRLMQRDGLYSKKTYWMDAVPVIRDLFRFVNNYDCHRVAKKGHHG